nr:hypothetical protein [Tanacetum cinerariifolium]
AQPTARNHAHRGTRNMVPAAVLAQSKPVFITAVRPVSTAVLKTSVTRPRHTKQIITKPKSPIKGTLTKAHPQKPVILLLELLLLRLQWLMLLRALKDKGVIDSRCSIHMTGNMYYLSDFEELNGGYVAFGGNPKGGKISGKGKIRTGKLDFDDVYFVKELKFNLFSVLQMCNKKNIVLFTDTECLVLSPEFKLPDESQVLLRVPRENNMYNNRVLVTKPQNKTPYALLHGRTPSIGFMRPFGSLVTILNTLDSLGKFDRKVNEGLLVRYSVSSKAFRVFDSRTRIVQETLHVNFLENKPNVAGNQSNPSAGFQDKFDAKKAGEESDQQYVPFLVWSSVPTAGHISPNNTNTFSATGPLIAATSPTHGKSLFIDASQLPDDTDMQELEDITSSNDEDDVGAEADFNNLETSIIVSPIPTTRVHKDHHVTQIIGDLSSATQIRSMARVVKDQGGLSQMFNDDFHTFDFPYGKRAIGTKWVFRNKKDEKGIVVRNKARLVAQGHIQKERIDYEEVFAPEEVYVCQPPGFEDPDYHDKVYKVVKALYGLHQAPRACQDKYVVEILRNLRLTDTKSASTPIYIEKPLLKDNNGEDVYVHTYRSMIRSLMYLTSSSPDIMFAVCACACFQVTPKASRLHAVKRIFRYLKGKPHLGLWFLKDSPFDLVAYSDCNYVGASLDRKSTTGGCQFLGCRLISWQCKKQIVVATSSTEAEYVAAANCCAQVLWIQNQLLDYGLQALVDKKKVVVTEATIREVLRLDDAKGVECLPSEEFFVELARMGYEKPSTKHTFYKAIFSSKWKFLIHTILQCMSAKRTSWNEFSSSMASAVICLSSGRKFNFSKYIFDNLVRNVDSPSKFYMCPRFLQLIIRKQVGDLSTHTTKYTSPALTHKVFANMRRVGKRFFGVETPLFEGMLVAQEVGEGVADAKHDEGVPAAGVVTEGDVSAAHDEVPTAAKEPFIPSPTPPTPPPQPYYDTPSTSQGFRILYQNPLTLILGFGFSRNDCGCSRLFLRILYYYFFSSSTRSSSNSCRSSSKCSSRNLSFSSGNSFTGSSNSCTGSTKFDSNVAFLQKIKEQIEEEESRALKRINETPVEREAKRKKLDEENNKPYYKIIRADGTHQLYISFLSLLRNFDREDLEALWVLVKERFADTKPKNFSDDFLLITLGAMFKKPDIHAQIWKNQKSVHGPEKVKGWKLLESCGVQIITFTTTQLILLVERKYPLTRFTLDQMLNDVRLKVKEESEVSLDLLRFVRQQHQEGGKLE